MSTREKREKRTYKSNRTRNYSDLIREQARMDYLAGDSTEEIAARIGCVRRTITNWLTAGNWETQLKSRRQSIVNLEQQIARLSQGEITNGTAQRIAMLTRSVERLRKNAPQPKPKPNVRESISNDLLNSALQEMGLYEYQKRLLVSDNRFEIIKKSRQIGFSYVLALRALLRAASGRNQIILSASQEQSDILINYAIQHAATLNLELDASSRSELTLGTNVIRALPANQRTVQGFNGDVVLDEFAWQQKQRAIWRAVLPSITAVGGCVTVCSTPFVPGDLFWEICENHKNRFPNWERYTISIHDALAQGMPLPGGLEELRSLFDAESWAMMYECQWAEDGSALLGWELLKELATGTEQYTAVEQPVYVGVDVGRINDRTAIAIVLPEGDKFRLLNLIELKGKDFAAQRQAVFDVFRRYHVKRLQIDRTGIGMQLAEEISSLHPNSSVGKHFTRQSKEKWALNLLKLAEDKRLILPNNPALLAQLHAVKRQISGNGIKYDAARDEQGHADAFWALALAVDGLAKNQGENVIVEIW